MPETEPRYWAFLSYSHADARFAQWLRRKLEGYPIPGRLVGRTTPAGVVPARLRPIFRDREEMGAGPDLSERLKAALSDSAYLIVICSPAAVKSAWVNEEIRRFKALRGDERVLAVMINGDPFASELADGADRECFPEPLRRRLAGEAPASGSKPWPRISGRARTAAAAPCSSSSPEFCSSILTRSSSAMRSANIAASR